MRKLTKNLIKKSKESFLLSLELFNKPTINYRTESFALLFTNAWEIILKAKIYEDSNGKKLSIFSKKERNKRRETISLDKSLRKIFDEDNLTKRIIEYISDIRNESVHFIIEELDPYFSRVFQKGVFLYIDFVFDNFNIDLSKELNPGFISLITNEKDIINMELLKSKRISKEDIVNIQSWVDRFNTLGKLEGNNLISLKYNVAIVKNPKKADTIFYGGDDNYANYKTIEIERKINPDDVYIHTRKDALGKINKELGGDLKINNYDFEAYCFLKNIKTSVMNDYHWKGKTGNSQYSEKFIEEAIIFFLSRDNKQVARSKYSKYLKR